MDSNSDDRDPEVQPDASPDELQEALRWLEEMAGRPSAGPDVSEAATEFPFDGLIDSEEGDLPDWLREAPPVSADSPLTSDGEFESRLDWLAKMAERESIEELPTLEWRHLADAPAPVDQVGGEAMATDLDTLPPFAAEEMPVEATPVEPLRAEAVVHLPPPAGEPEEQPDYQAEVDAAMPALLEEATEVEEALPDLAATDLAATDLAATDLAANAPITAEALLDTLPPDEELPPINDLDAAMAWIEELAASQDAPIEDVPSVADRALTSKLLMEAGLSPDGLDLRAPGNELALGDLSLLEGSTPINSFVAEEDFADTIVLVETMAAEQGRPLVIPPSEPEFAPAAAIADEVSFDEAMAFLDDLAADDSLGAVTQPLMPIEIEAREAEADMTEMAAAVEELAAPALEEAWAAPMDEAEAWTPVEGLSADDVPWATTELAEVVEEIAAPLVDESSADNADRVAEPIEWSADGDVIVGQLEPSADSADMVAEQVEWRADSDAVTAEQLELSADSTDVAGEQPELSANSAPLGDEMAPLPLPSDSAIAANGDRAADLEETLRALDALALPAGTSLAELDLSLRRGGAPPARRDLPAAVEWLELALGISVPTTVPTAVPTPPLTDEDLVARMPDDPDAVLAWLEQMAEEDTVDSSPQLGGAGEMGGEVKVASAAPLSTPMTTAKRAGPATEPLIDELSDADLLNMPEDPDAVMAWLEGLAAGAPPERREPVPAPVTAEMPPPTPALPEQAAEAPVAVSRSRRRRGRKAKAPLADEPLMSEEPAALVMNDVEPSLPDAPVEEMAESFGDVGVMTEVAAEMPEAAVGMALEEGGLLVWPAVDETPDVPLPPEAPIEAPTITYPEVAPLAAQPRRRGRKPKGEAPPTTEAPILVIDAVEATSDQGAAEIAGEAKEAEEPAATPPPEATPPAKPASWVDLLKPLR